MRGVKHSTRAIAKARRLETWRVFNKKRYYDNPRADNISNKKRLRAYQKRTLKHADNNGNLWTPKECEALHRLCLYFFTDEEIALMLGRTYRAVKTRREILKIKKI